MLEGNVMKARKKTRMVEYVCIADKHRLTKLNQKFT